MTEPSSPLISGIFLSGTMPVIAPLVRIELWLCVTPPKARQSHPVHEVLTCLREQIDREVFAHLDFGLIPEFSDAEEGETTVKFLAVSQTVPGTQDLIEVACYDAACLVKNLVAAFATLEWRVTAEFYAGVTEQGPRTKGVDRMLEHLEFRHL